MTKPTKGTSHLRPIPGQPRGYEVVGERVTPPAPCPTCGAQVVAGSRYCAAHAEPPVAPEERPEL